MPNSQVDMPTLSRLDSANRTAARNAKYYQQATCEPEMEIPPYSRGCVHIRLDNLSNSQYIEVIRFLIGLEPTAHKYSSVEE